MLYFGKAEGSRISNMTPTCILLGTSRYFGGTSRYFEVLLGTSRYFEVLLGTLRYFWVL